MSCPYLKEVVMLFCDAYPVKKMLPLDRLATAHPCLGCDFEKCPLYLELVSRLACGAGEHGRSHFVAEIVRGESSNAVADFP